MDPVTLVRYNHFLRRRFAEHFGELPWEVLSEDHGTSHSNIANVFMHGCNMEDWWLHYLVPGKAWDGPAYDGFTDAGTMQQRVAEVEAKTEAFLRTLRPGDLEREHEVEPSEGEKVRLTLGQILTELVLEDTHHRGEIMAMLWRKDIAPAYVPFAEWVRAGGAMAEGGPR